MWPIQSALPREVRTASIGDLDALATKARGLDLAAVRPRLAHAIRKLRAAGIGLSDRRAVKLQRLIAAAAVIAGRERATEADLWPIVFALPTAEAQRIGRDALRDVLEASENKTLQLPGPLVRQVRIVAPVQDPVRPPAQEAEVRPAVEEAAERHRGVEVEVPELAEERLERVELVGPEVRHDHDRVGVALEDLAHACGAGERAHVHPVRLERRLLAPAVAPAPQPGRAPADGSAFPP